MKMTDDVGIPQLRDLLEVAAVVNQQDILHSIDEIILKHQGIRIGQVREFGKFQSGDSITVDQPLADVMN